MFQSNFYLSTTQFNPTIFFDITKEIGIKKKSLECYDKQHNRHNNLFEMTIKRNEIWGKKIRKKYAEAFVPLKMVHE